MQTECWHTQMCLLAEKRNVNAALYAQAEYIQKTYTYAVCWYSRSDMLCFTTSADLEANLLAYVDIYTYCIQKLNHTRFRALASRADVLSFTTSAELEADLDVVGVPIASISFSSDLPSADLVVRICDVYPDGERNCCTFMCVCVCIRQADRVVRTCDAHLDSERKSCSCVCVCV
jgi:hypothetical protein